MSRRVRKSSDRWPSPRRSLLVAGLSVFIVVDIVLVALALGWGRAEPVSDALDLDSPTQSEPTAEDYRSPVETPSPSPGGDISQSIPRHLAVASDSVAWRSEAGPCEERGSLELTMDGGQTWSATYPPEDHWGHPLWVSGSDYTSVQSVIASGDDCDLEGIRTFDSGASWNQDGDIVSESVLVDPSDSAVIVWGGEDIASPCEATSDVAATEGVATAICADGSLWRVPYGGSDWSRHDVQGAVALDASNGRWVAAAESEECEGLGLVEIAEAAPEYMACVPTEPDGATALGLAEDTLWLWTGEEVLVSVDGGRSFG